MTDTTSPALQTAMAYYQAWTSRNGACQAWARAGQGRNK
jgi:hypothetical protein